METYNAPVQFGERRGKLNVLDNNWYIVLEHRWAEHIRYVRNWRLDQATGAHFNIPGHNIGHMTFSFQEMINNNIPQYRKARESHFIEKFNLKYAGMNLKR